MAKKKEEKIKEEETKATPETEETSEREIEIELNSLKEALNKAENEKKELEDRLLRTLAEYDNFKKRTRREKEELGLMAKGEVIKKLLPVFDNFDRAQNFAAAEDYAKGVEMIVRQFFEILESMDIHSIAAEGDEFDPNFHEAVFREEKEGVPENQITEVLQKGYAMGDKVIRHAMVKVSG